MVHNLSRLALLTLTLMAPLSALVLPAARGQEVVRQSATGAEPDAESLYKKSVQFAQSGSYGQSLGQLFAAVQLWHQAGQSGRAITALTEMSDFYFRRGHWQEALRGYSRLLLCKPLPDKTRALTFNALAAAYARLRQFDLATDYYQKALALARQIRDRLLESQALTGLAGTACERGQPKAASALLDRALQLQRLEYNESAQAETLRLIGQMHEQQGRAAEAHGAYEQALALYRKASDGQEGQAQLLCRLSGLSLAAGRKQEANARATEAVNLIAALKSGDARWRAYLALARAERALGQAPAARKSYYRAYGAIEGQLIGITADALRIAYMEDRQALYHELVELLLDLGEPEEAFNVAEAARARATLNLLAGGAHAEQKAAPAEPGKALQAAAQAVTTWRARLQLSALSEAERRAAQAQFKQAVQRLDETQLEMQMARRSRFVLPATLKQVQASLAGPSDVLIEFMLNEGRSYAWLVSAAEARCVTLPGKREIEQKITEFLAATTEPPNSLYLEYEMARQKKLAGQVFEMLLGPFRSQLQTCRRLLIAPDGLLYYLPFEALVSDDHYLIETSAIDYVPSASTLRLLIAPGGAPEAGEQMDLLAVGDPLFAPPAAGGKRGRGEGETAPIVGSSDGARLPRLPNTRQEVLAIGALFPAARQTLYLDRRATEDALKREPLRRYRRIHFATHSLIDERYPSRSGVLLTTDETGHEDGVLTADEIALLDLRCQLVVLSACRTGRGKLVAGEGRLGLARVFLYAGAQAVAVSLWNVSDLATADFMKLFYSRLVAGASPLAALRQAKIDLLRSRNAMRHPYYWAPFVLVGNPN